MLMNIAISNEVTRSMVFNKFKTFFHAMRKYRGNANKYSDFVEGDIVRVSQA